MSSHVIVALVGLIAGALSGMIGTGSSVLLMPVLVATFGPKTAVPIMAIAAIVGNLARVMAWWREIAWRPVAAYLGTAVPAAACGAILLIELPARAVDIGLGVFFLAMVPGRRWLARRAYHLTATQLAVAGAPIGLLTGIVLSTGPLSLAAFSAAGLSKGGLLASEAAASLAIYVTKSTTFRAIGALPWETLANGLAVGASLMVGTFVGKAALLRMSPAIFESILDVTMIVSGLSLLVTAFT